MKEKLKQLKRDIPALYLVLKHPDTPVPAKLIAGAAVIYALSPVDLIPDFIPVLGYLDDLLILPFLVWAALRLIPVSVIEECRARAEGMWNDGKPKKWYYAAPIILIWALIIYIAAKNIILWKTKE